MDQEELDKMKRKVDTLWNATPAMVGIVLGVLVCHMMGWI